MVRAADGAVSIGRKTMVVASDWSATRDTPMIRVVERPRNRTKEQRVVNELPPSETPEGVTTPIEISTGETTASRELSDATLFINRELSFLEFNKRVLDQALDSTVPLLERVRFLTISCTNLDEFFEIRVAGLREQKTYAGSTSVGPDGLQPLDALKAISKVAHHLVQEQYRILNEVLLPELEKERIKVLSKPQWTAAQRQWVRRYFFKEVFPVLTPVGLDPAHPFPRIVNKSLNFILRLQGKDAFGRSGEAAVVQAPRVLPRLIQMPNDVAGAYDFVLLSSVISAHIGELFPGMNVTGVSEFRVTRNGDLWVDEEEVDDLLHALQGELQRRRYGDAVRLEVSKNCSVDMTRYLLEQFELEEDDLFKVDGQVNLNRLAALNDLVDRPDLKYPPFVPALPRRLAGAPDIFEVIRQGDILLHHPYESFMPVVDLLRSAAADPHVLAIKMTVYRTGQNSPLCEALFEAARAGKEVTAVIELRARFDEENNIRLATRLQEAGAKVVYGVVGYKAHAKMVLIVRREQGNLRRYVHVGTGNYHLQNTRIYTDFSLLTCDDEIGEDVHNIFQQLTGLGRVTQLKKLLQSPFTMHGTLIDLIEAEIENARRGDRAHIMGRMNALLDPKLTQALYRASRAGVKIDLVVRGICCLRPGIPGISDNVRIRSIVSRFLEHSRVYYFFAGGKQLTFCSSADWMPRNLFRRVEVAFPITDPAMRERVIEESLLLYFEDNLRAWELQSDGSYIRCRGKEGETTMGAQAKLLATLSEKRP